MKGPMSGQAMVFFAIALPIVLVPVAGYAIDATVVATREARLQEVAALAAEEAAQQLDVARLRSGAGIQIDPAQASRVAAATVEASEPQATVGSVVVSPTTVTVSVTLLVVVPVNVLGRPAATLSAQASARLAAGYDSPSSFLPLPTSSF